MQTTQAGQPSSSISCEPIVILSAATRKVTEHHWQLTKDEAIEIIFALQQPNRFTSSISPVVVASPQGTRQPLPSTPVFVAMPISSPGIATVASTVRSSAEDNRTMIFIPSSMLASQRATHKAEFASCSGQDSLLETKEQGEFSVKMLSNGTHHVSKHGEDKLPRSKSRGKYRRWRRARNP